MADPTSAPAKPRAPLTFDGTTERPRSKVVPLSFPFAITGTQRRIESVTVRRLSAAEVDAVWEKIGQGADKYDQWAMFTDVPGFVLREMDRDDWDEVWQNLLGFLPRAILEQLAEPDTSGSPSESTDQSSSGSAPSLVSPGPSSAPGTGSAS